MLFEKCGKADLMIFVPDRGHVVDRRRSKLATESFFSLLTEIFPPSVFHEEASSQSSVFQFRTVTSPSQTKHWATARVRHTEKYVTANR